MMESILTIVAALLPLLLDIIEAKRKEKPYDDAQTIRHEVVAGDVNALAVRIDRLRQKPQVYVMDDSKPVLLKKGDVAPADGYWLSPGAMADLIQLAGSGGGESE